MRRSGLLLLVCALVAALTGCVKSQPDGNAIVVAGEDDGFNGALLSTPYDVPDLELTDTEGAPYSLPRDARKPLTLVFFGYTRCPDICQAVMANIASALARLDEEQRAEVDVVLVTTDPERDDGPLLRSYLDRYGDGFVGLTGDIKTIKRLGRSVGVFIARGQELPDGGYEVDHSAPVIGVEKGRHAPIVWTQGRSAAEMAEDIAKLLGR